MKKIILFFLMFFSLPSHAEIARATDSFMIGVDNLRAYGSIVLSNETVYSTTVQRVKYHRLSVKQFDFLRDSTESHRYFVDINDDNSLSIRQRWWSNDSTECVAFVQFASNLNWIQSSKWGKGAKVTKSNLPLRGTVLATFDSNGDYGADDDKNGHTVVTLSSDSTGVIVIDENYGNEGKVHIWKMRFDSNGFYSNPSNYNVVLTKKL